MKKLFQLGILACLVMLVLESKAQTSAQYYYGMGNVSQLSIWQNIDAHNLLNVRIGYKDFTDDNISLSVGYGHTFGAFLPYLVFNKDVTSSLNNYSFTNGYYWTTGTHWDVAIGWTLTQNETIIDGNGSSERPLETIHKWKQSYWLDVYYNINSWKAQIGIEGGVSSSGNPYWGIMINKSFNFRKH